MKYLIALIMGMLLMLSFASAVPKTANIPLGTDARVTTVWNNNTVFYNIIQERKSIDKGYINLNNKSVILECKKNKKIEVCKNITKITKLTDAQVEALILSKAESKLNVIPVKRSKQNLIIKLWQLVKG